MFTPIFGDCAEKDDIMKLAEAVRYLKTVTVVGLIHCVDQLHEGMELGKSWAIIPSLSQSAMADELLSRRQRSLSMRNLLLF